MSSLRERDFLSGRNDEAHDAAARMCRTIGMRPYEDHSEAQKLNLRAGAWAAYEAIRSLQEGE